jgi:hypothetical protein
MTDLAALTTQLVSGDPSLAASAATQLAKRKDINPDFNITVYDQLWRPIAAIGDECIEHTGTDPRNTLPSATLKLKGDSPLIDLFMNCRKTMVGVTFETGGQRFAFYCDTFDYTMTDKGEWTGTANLLGIWDVLNYLVIWADWTLPIQAQVKSYAVFIWALVTVLEHMVAEQALRIQSGLWEFVNNAGSLNPDVRAWFGTLLQSNGNIFTMLKTPIYVVRTDPLTDTSSLYAKTVRFETVAAVLKDITKAYGVDVRVDLWLPGDEQPDYWSKNFSIMTLTQPTYVVTVKDRSQVTGPTKTVLDSVLRTTVDLEGSMLGNVLDPLLNPQGQYAPEGIYIAPRLGLNFVMPWVVVIAPEPGERGSVATCKISDHTPKGWQHIIGGRSPKWLNDLMNATFAWIIDSITILLGVTGIPSDLLAGFLNNSFLAFQLVEHYQRRSEVGPYHPGIEVMHTTASAPYNIETLFAFINAFWDTRGWTSAQCTLRNGEVYTLGTDIMRGALVSIVYRHRTRMFTDYVDNVMWRFNAKSRDLFLQIGDGKAKESPLAKHQRYITSVMEAINVLTLAPQAS